MTEQEKEAYLDQVLEELNNPGKEPSPPVKKAFDWKMVWRALIVLTAPIWGILWFLFWVVGRDIWSYIKTGEFEQ